MYNFTWINFFKELGEKLLGYENKQQDLIAKMRQAIMNAYGKPSKAVDYTCKYGMDPFTVAAVLCDNHSAANKRKLCGQYKLFFQLESDIPSSFDGIPVQNHTNVAFRSDDDSFTRNQVLNDIAVLWRLFKEMYGSEKEFCSAFDDALRIRSVGLAKLSMGLFYYRPDYYPSLDRKTKLYLHSFRNKLSLSKENGEAYILLANSIRDDCTKNNMTVFELSDYAYQYALSMKDINKTNAASDNIVYSEKSETEDRKEELYEIAKGYDDLVGDGYPFKEINKSKPKTVNGIKVFERKKIVSKIALNRAGNVCEYDENHESFVRKSDGKTKYLEPHHLIPMFASEKYGCVLDNVQNIVCLCSECHNRIHYGMDADILIKTLYKKRKKDLKDIKIDIGLEELLSLYHFSQGE